MRQPKSVLIIGAGGHGQVVADILLNSQGKKIHPVGFLDDNAVLHGEIYLGIRVIGRVNILDEIRHDGIILAVGNNQARHELYKRFARKGETFVNAIHPRAILSRDVEVGRGVTVCAGAIVNTGTVIEDNVILNTGCTIDHHNRISCSSHIAPGVNLGGNVVVGTGAFVGIGSAVIPGVKVGVWATLGAGGVAICNIPDHATAVGVPARTLPKRMAGLSRMTPTLFDNNDQ